MMKAGNKAKRHFSHENVGPLTYVILMVWSLFSLAPLTLVLINSFRSNQEIYMEPLALPTKINFENYVTAWSKASFSTYFFNSLMITSLSIALGLLIASLAAYPLARKSFFGRSFLSNLFLAGLLLPAQLGILPVFKLMDTLGLVGSPFSLVIVYSVGSLPLAIVILTSFMRQIPESIEEAAQIDGAGEIRIFVSLILPLSRPAIATVAIVQAAPIWNDFFYPLVLLRDKDRYTLPIGLTEFFGQYQSDYGLLFAGLVIVSLPLVVVFIFATKQVIRGLTNGIEK
jgi:raffinose/stachyose/melibiose transport system permease protein